MKCAFNREKQVRGLQYSANCKRIKNLFHNFTGPVVEVDEVEDTYNDDEDIKPVEESEQKSEMPAPSKETTTVSESPEGMSY